VQSHGVSFLSSEYAASAKLTGMFVLKGKRASSEVKEIQQPALIPVLFAKVSASF